VSAYLIVLLSICDFVLFASIVNCAMYSTKTTLQPQGLAFHIQFAYIVYLSCYFSEWYLYVHCCCYWDFTNLLHLRPYLSNLIAEGAVGEIVDWRLGV